LITKLSHVASQAQEADFRPTDQEVAVNAQYTREIKSWEPELAQLIGHEVAAFNQQLLQLNLKPIDTTVPAPRPLRPGEEREAEPADDDSSVVLPERPGTRMTEQKAGGRTA